MDYETVEIFRKDLAELLKKHKIARIYGDGNIWVELDGGFATELGNIRAGEYDKPSRDPNDRVINTDTGEIYYWDPSRR